MKIKADWWVVKFDIVFAGLFSLVFATGFMLRFHGKEGEWSGFGIAFLALMVFFCWRFISDLAKALIRVMSINRAEVGADRGAKSLASASALLPGKPSRALPSRVLPPPTASSSRADR